ncbi:hypothetical protein QWY14_10305 [Planococcus sp. N028]|uniref:Uncharacterized protein n=1 Tax=Planococcus shixiaomingii TaxID=3058393 RepID=A0ABT8N2S4_9BACL|nr:hypothetical protein [Planococcus sp. N028]MDN7242193.1 hypothetical protein [Planococcus sp. N028]
MEIVTVLGFSAVMGVLSVLAFFFSVSRKAEGFYEETIENPDPSGFFILVGGIIMGLHKLYQLIFKRYHILVLRITLFIFGAAFLIMGAGVWFLI